MFDQLYLSDASYSIYNNLLPSITKIDKNKGMTEYWVNKD